MLKTKKLEIHYQKSNNRIRYNSLKNIDMFGKLNREFGKNTNENI
jgi:hypothetical protein